MNRDTAYFCGYQVDVQMLKEHGFDHWPDSEELARYVFDVMDAICNSLGLELKRDHRRVWRAVPKPELEMAGDGDE